MSRFLAFILCIALLAQHLARFSVSGVYELRKEFVAQNLCENIGRPELNCCGKCVLEKQLAKADDRAGGANNAPKKTDQIESAVLRAERALTPIRPELDFIPKPFNPGGQRMYHSETEAGIFKPPLG